MMMEEDQAARDLLSEVCNARDDTFNKMREITHKEGVRGLAGRDGMDNLFLMIDAF